MKIIKETIEFIAAGQYTLPAGHNPLPTGWRGRLIALKWLLTGRRPSIEGYMSKPQSLVVSCFGAGGNGGVAGGNPTIQDSYGGVGITSKQDVDNQTR